MHTFIKKVISIFLGLILTSCNVILSTQINTPFSIPTSILTKTPLPTLTPTLSPTEDPKPKFPESGVMKSEHLTASLSQKWMDAAGFSKVELSPEILEQIYKTMLVHWASTLSSFSNDPKVKLFHDFYSCDHVDPIGYFDFLLYKPNAHLNNALEAYEINSKKSNSFDYKFDFGMGVVGEVEGIDIKVLANRQEYKFIEKELLEQNIVFVYQYGYDNYDDKSLVYFDSDHILHIYSWDGNPSNPSYLDNSVDNSYALLADLFLYPLVNGGVSILRTNKHLFLPGCFGYSMHEALGCANYYCNKSGNSPSNFEITMNDGNVIHPLSNNHDTIILTPTPQIITAADKPLQIENYSIYFNNVQVLDLGTNPLGLKSNLALSVYFTAANGDIQEMYSFTENDFWVTDEKGTRNDNIIIQSATSQDGTKYDRLIIYLSQPSKSYYLHFNFSAGEIIIDLTPLVK